MVPVIEEAAIAAYALHVRNAVGTLQFKRDPATGRVMTDKHGNWLREEPHEAVMRRWHSAPQRTRDEFIETANACFQVFAQRQGEFS